MANLNAHRMLQGHCLQLACLAVLHLAVHIHAALTEWLSLIWQLLWHATAAILHKVSGDRVRVKNAHQHSGKAPPAPRVLAAVLAETDLQAMPVEQVAALVGMCACAGLTDVSVYDPSGVPRPALPSGRLKRGTACCLACGVLGGEVSTLVRRFRAALSSSGWQGALGCAAPLPRLGCSAGDVSSCSACGTVSLACTAL